MISATLAFVRDATHEAQRTKLELSSLVQSIADEMAETGAEVSAEDHGPVVVEGDPVALRRLVTNLLDNAVKFGGQARARVYSENDAAIIEVDDDGPGVPEAERERVFEPFHRGEPSRSRETGGAGLGLAVVQVRRPRAWRRRRTGKPSRGRFARRATRAASSGLAAATDASKAADESTPSTERPAAKAVPAETADGDQRALAHLSRGSLRAGRPPIPWRAAGAGSRPCCEAGRRRP